MRLIKAESHWGCLPASLAMVVGADLSEIIKQIGHDGSRVVFPNEITPYRQRGFHIHEAIRVAYEHYDVKLMTVVINPVTVCGDDSFALPSDEAFFNTLIWKYPAILLGDTKQGGHACAYNCGDMTIYDPRGYTYPYDQPHDFIVQGGMFAI